MRVFQHNDVKDLERLVLLLVVVVVPVLYWLQGAHQFLPSSAPHSSLSPHRVIRNAIVDGQPRTRRPWKKIGLLGERDEGERIWTVLGKTKLYQTKPKN